MTRSNSRRPANASAREVLMLLLRRLLIASSLVLATAVSACEPTPSPRPAPSPPDSTPAPSRPTLGQWHQLVYDERLGTTVLVNGGPETGQDPDLALELWSW